MSIEDISVKLNKIRSQIRKYYFIDGFNKLLIVCSLLVSALILEKALLRVPDLGFTITLIISVVIAILCLIRYLIYPQTRKLSTEDIALLIEKEYPIFNDSLISTLQLQKSDDSSFRSSEMTKKLIEETTELSKDLDFSSVLKPNKLNFRGVLAIASTLLLSLVVFFSATQPRQFSIAFTLDFPDTISKYNVNFFKQPGNDKIHREIITIGESSDFIFRATPNAYNYSREFDILDFEIPQVHFVSTKNNSEDIIPMKLATDNKGRKVYEHLEDKIRFGEWTMFVSWEKKLSPKYLIKVKPAPTVVKSVFKYRAPEHMRAARVLIEKSSENFPEAVYAQVEALTTGGFEIMLPEKDENNRIVRDASGKAKMTNVAKFNNEDEFEANLPDIFANYVREKVEQWSMTINELEGTKVSILLTLNKELILQNSRMIVFYKQKSGQNIPPIELPFTLVNKNPETSTFLYKIEGDDFQLALNMLKYQFHFEDVDHLRQNELISYPINVKSDQKPFAKFIYSGASLKEGSSERLITPSGFIPLIIEATDDFGISDLRLYYWLKGNFTERFEVPGFSDIALFHDFPTSKRIEFNVQISRLLHPEIIESMTDDTSILLSFQLEIEDIKKSWVKENVDGNQVNVRRGQMFNSDTLDMHLVTLQRLQQEIRYILRKIIKKNIDDLIVKQDAMILASSLFRRDLNLLESGLAFSTIFPAEDVRKDSAGNELRFDVQQIGRIQDEITRTSFGMVFRLDSIIRHYINNDLEKQDDTKPQENKLQELKIMLLLSSISKDKAIGINNYLKILNSYSSGGGNVNYDTIITKMFTDLLNNDSGLVNVRASFDKTAFGEELQIIDLQQAGCSREAALAYEELLDSDIVDSDRKRLLTKAKDLQEQNLFILEKCQKLLELWEGFEERRERLRKLMELQEGVAKKLEDFAPKRD